MSISFPRTLPNLSDVAQIVRRQKTLVSVSEGLFSGVQQLQKQPFQRWEIEYTIIPLNRANIDVWLAWLVSLNGREKTFYSGMQAPNEIKGSAKDYLNPQLNGVHTIRLGSLSIDSGPNSITGYLKEGDFIQLGSTTSSRLHMVLEDVNTDGSGQASFDIWPDTQASYSDNATVTVSSPVGVFRLMQNSIELIQDGSNTRKGLRFSAAGVI